jgi:hypothetical protein
VHRAAGNVGDGAARGDRPHRTVTTAAPVSPSPFVTNERGHPSWHFLYSIFSNNMFVGWAEVMVAVPHRYLIKRDVKHWSVRAIAAPLTASVLCCAMGSSVYCERF